MCLAIYKKSGENFNIKKIKQAWENNPHGSGLAIKRHDKIEVIKGIMYKKELIDIIEQNNHFKNFEVLLHLRWSTSGSIIPELTHPFPISFKNSDIRSTKYFTDKCLIHNGVLFNPIINNYSDTAIFSKYLSFNKNHENDELIKGLIGRDKVAIFETDKPTRLFGDWHEIDGVHYSNLHSFDHYPTFNFGNYDKINDDFCHYDDHNEVCPICESEDIERIGIHSNTYECFDCYSIFNEKYFLEPVDQYELNYMKKRG